MTTRPEGDPHPLRAAFQAPTRVHPGAPKVVQRRWVNL